MGGKKGKNSLRGVPTVALGIDMVRDVILAGVAGEMGVRYADGDPRHRRDAVRVSLGHNHGETSRVPPCSYADGRDYAEGHRRHNMSYAEGLAEGLGWPGSTPTAPIFGRRRTTRLSAPRAIPVVWLRKSRKVFPPFGCLGSMCIYRSSITELTNAYGVYAITNAYGVSLKTLNGIYTTF
jgi:hypothetical protein